MLNSREEIYDKLNYIRQYRSELDIEEEKLRKELAYLNMNLNNNTVDEQREYISFLYAMIVTADIMDKRYGGNSGCNVILNYFEELSQSGSKHKHILRLQKGITRVGGARSVFSKTSTYQNAVFKEDNLNSGANQFVVSLPLIKILNEKFNNQITYSKFDKNTAVEYFVNIYNNRDNPFCVNDVCVNLALMAYNTYYKNDVSLQTLPELDDINKNYNKYCDSSKQNNDGYISASTNVGRRKNNQDSYICMRHPKNKDIKILAVADGMGGHKDGEEASNFVIKKLEEYFVNMPLSSFNRTNDVCRSLRDYLNQVNRELISRNERKCSDSGTTLTLAVVLKNKTIIYNVGDSRTYKSKDGNLCQVTDDHSPLWHLYKRGAITKEEFKVARGNNAITQAFGSTMDHLDNPDIKIIDNSEYDSLLLFSDGVTDLLSDNTIQIVNNNTPKEEIADMLVKKAVFEQQYYIDKNKSVALPTGKDNATAVVYVKK